MRKALPPYQNDLSTLWEFRVFNAFKEAQRQTFLTEISRFSLFLKSQTLDRVSKSVSMESQVFTSHKFVFIMI